MPKRFSRHRWPWPLARCVVAGESMVPSYRPGQRLLVNRLAYVARAPRPGDVVLLRDPEHPTRLLLKRVIDSRDRVCLVHGDNAHASRDSRHFGPVPRQSILGKVLCRY